MSDLTTAMTAARLHDVQSVDADRAVGRLKLSGGLMARCVATCTGGDLRAQVQLMLADDDATDWRATQLYLDSVVARISGVDTAAGHCADRGVIYLEAAGQRPDAARLLALLTALARVTLEAAAVLTSEAELAQTYLRIRGSTDRETNSPSDGR